jgi:hypothetical protein
MGQPLIALYADLGVGVVQMATDKRTKASSGLLLLPPPRSRHRPPARLPALCPLRSPGVAA